MKSIGARLFAGYLLGIGAALCGFIVVLALGMKFNAADDKSRAAVSASAQATQISHMTVAAEAALLRFQSTLSGQDRTAMETMLGRLAELDPRRANLKTLAGEVSDLSQKLQVGVSTILDATSAIAMPVMTLAHIRPADPTGELAVAADRMAHNFALLAASVGRFVAQGDTRSIAMARDTLGRVRDALARIDRAPATDAPVKNLLAIIQRDLKNVEDLFETQIQNASTQKAAVQEFGKALNVVKEEARVNMERADAGFKEASDTAHAASDLLLTSVWVAAPTTLMLGLLIALLMGRAIAHPVNELTSSVKQIANGNLDVELAATKRRDELGQLAQSVLVLRDQSRAKVRLEGEAASQRETAERERNRAEAERIAAAREQAQVVGMLGDALSKLANRDLTAALVDFPGEYKKLEIDFNAAVEALRETVSVVATNTHAMLTGVAEISAGGVDLARRTENQASSLEQTAAAIDEITATGRKSAEGANLARDTVAAAKQDAEKTGVIVRKTVDAMSNIEKGAQKINQIISVIDEIAFQTNLLALNAGVEAARAGEAGRGFAVVASEVRGLAQRSAEAAKEIKQLISSSSAQVAEGVDLVAEAGKAVERILGQVGDINKLVTDIASGAQEQATGLAQVNTAINQMDQATQQNASMVQQSSAASNSLKLEAEQLVELMSQFRLQNGRADGGSAHWRSAPARGPGTRAA